MTTSMMLFANYYFDVDIDILLYSYYNIGYTFLYFARGCCADSESSNRIENWLAIGCPVHRKRCLFTYTNEQ